MYYLLCFRQNELNKIIEKRKEKFNFSNNEKIKCNLNYPICIEECNKDCPIHLKVTYEKISKEEKEENNINQNEIVENEEINDEDILKDIIIERRKHFCQQ